MHSVSLNQTVDKCWLLVSVIVPIYNVVGYLEMCISSIISQTYSNLEILLIDDGSTDGSELICDIFSKRDGRIQVFHTDNRGLSASRNYGVEKSRGEWVVFIDADDWVDSRMISRLVEAVETHEAEIGICGYYLADRRQEKKRICTERVEVLCGNERFQAFICKNRISNSIWNKIYKRELFSTKETFPNGRNYEDSIALTRLLLRSNCAVLIPDCLYYYRRRKNGIVGTHTLKNESDRWVSYKEVYDELNDRIPEYHNELLHRTVNGIKGIWKYYHIASNEDKIIYSGRVKEALDFIKEHSKEIMEADFPFTMNIWMWIFNHPSRIVYAVLYYITRIRRSRVKKDYY